MNSIDVGNNRWMPSVIKPTLGRSVGRQFVLSAIIAGFVSILAGLPALHAQATDGILVGTVTDATQVAIPNVTVAATNKATGVKYTTISTAVGNYRINNLPIGAYGVDATANGMAPLKVSNVL